MISIHPCFARWGLSILLFLPFPLSAGSVPNRPLSHMMITRFDTESGCPAHEVNTLLRTRDGYLWIGGRQGLFRYDGVRYVPFDRVRFPELRSSHIRTLFEDSKDNLWIGTSGGGVSILSGEHIKTITSREGLGSDYVRAIAEDTNGVIWIGTDGEGITAIRRDTMITYGKENSILDERVTSLLVDNRNRLWIGTYAGLFSFDGNGFERIGRRDGLPCDTVLSLYGRENELWIGTYGGGVGRFTEGKITTYGRENGLPGGIVTAITEDVDGSLWFATLRGGVCRLKDGGFSSRALGQIGQGEYAIALACDRERNLWVGLLNGGLVQMREPPISWLSLGSSGMVSGVTADHRGKVWAATSNGVREIRGEVLVKPATGGLPEVPVITVAEAKDGVMWAGTWNNGLYERAGNTFKKFALAGASTVWALFADTDGAMWTGTSAGVFRILNGSSSRYTHNASGLSHDDVRAFARDAGGALWVGTSYGLNRKEGDSFRIFTTKNSRLPNDVVLALYADETGYVWVGTDGGMARVRGDSILAFTMRDGLPGEAVGQIIGDEQGYLWIVSGKGLHRILKSDFDKVVEASELRVHPEEFGRAEGLVRTNLSGMVQPAAWKTPDGRLWFGAGEGVAMIDPSTIREDSLRPHVVIEEFLADRKSLPLGSVLEVGHDSGQFEIVYTAPSYVRPTKIHFRYILEGLDDHWIDAGTRRTAYYSKIPPGTYTFRVAAGNEDGPWNTTEASIELTVLPPLWLTWWFRGIVGILLIGAIYSLYRKKVARLRREKAVQSRFSSMLIETLEEERKRMAAEIHDSLGQGIIIMKNRALLGGGSSGDRDVVIEQFNEIAHTATTTLDEIRKIAHNLRPVHLERFGLTETIRTTVENISRSSPIELRTELQNIDGSVSKENEIHIFRIVQEALSNIVKHSSARSATVSARTEPGNIRLIVRDDGRGFDGGQLDRDQGRVGIGLGNILHRTEMLRGAVSVESSPGCGTTITVSIPVDQEKKPLIDLSGPRSA